MFEEFYIRIDEDEKKVEVDFEETGKLVKKMNEKLIAMQDSLGMKPSFVNALSFTEKIATYAMRGITKKDYKELGFDENFKEIIRFAELTSIDKPYSDAGFERFWRGFTTDFSRGWSDEDNIPNYSRLTMHVMGNVASLAKKYRDENKPDYMIDSLWSGNLVHELVGLTDPK